MQEIKVLITDDHQLVIEGIRALLADVENITVVGEAVNGKDCLEKLASIDADVVLMDMDMPIMSGIDATQLIAKTYPNIKVLALTMYNEKALIQKCWKPERWDICSKTLVKRNFSALLQRSMMVSNILAARYPSRCQDPPQ